jgi:2-oxoglutarate dehydrogenase complex dehydrogenase (E1) component-like enzyme
MLEGYDVRISGQDVGRGTFSHRHAMLVNQKTEGVVVPLNEALGAQGKLELANSASAFCVLSLLLFYASIGSLSEFAVLGVFEAMLNLSDDVIELTDSIV